ncbi:MAG: aromatic ring-hydroxylating dioxygenase subunit alpha [Pseudomonadota bacterium]|nr:aromatic ring-hydroxylating dioxygenase subunit alpha [Pseudomonadota bacterium]
MKNCWYVAAWDYEITTAPLSRTILGQPVVLFRDSTGRPAALEDRCCHRHLPLSRGRVVGNRIRCGYHGLEFNAAGNCIAVPGQSKVPPDAVIQSYPVVERYRWVWIWPGDPDLVDPDLIPDYHWNDDPEWCSYGDVFYVAGDYRLLIDNLIDLSHIQFLHSTTLGAANDADAEVEVRRDARGLTVSRWVMDTPPAPMYAHALQTDDNVDRWQNIHYSPPSHVVIDAGSAIAGTGARTGDRSAGVETYSNHSLTPETGKSSHYFWHHARNFRLDDEAFTADLRNMFSSALMEDVVAIGEQQASIDRVGDRPTIDIHADAAAIQARRLLEEQIGAEG